MCLQREEWADQIFRIHNIRAQRLYRRLGFSVEGIKRQEVWRYGRYLDSQLMSMLKSEYVPPRVDVERK